MGFPTPFPEPDSPELQRFAVRSPSEIVSRLRALQEAAFPLNAFVDAGASFGVVTLQDVDEIARKLVFAGTASDGLHDRLPGAPMATFVGYHTGGKLQFAVRPVRGGGVAGDQTFATPIPERLFPLQRRTAARMRVESAREAVCRIPIPGGAGHWEALRVLDIGTGGLAMLTYPERFKPVLGSEIDGCRLDLPGVGGAIVSVRVRHLGPMMVGEERARFCGCEFLRITPALGAMIERFVVG
ncbi:MAG: flagellar brake protein [Burkholderiales bacterium]|nr:flagellar brake protein [Burkholderiales bacterium]